MKRREKTEIIKAEIPAWLANKFRSYVARKYGFKRGSLSKAIEELIKKELGLTKSPGSNTIDSIIGLGLESDYEWEGEDLVEALRRRTRVVSNRR